MEVIKCKSKNYVSSISIIITAIMTVFPLALGVVIERFFPDTDGVVFIIAAAVILSITVGSIKCRFKWVFCVIPPAFMLIYGLIDNDIDSISFSPFLALGSSTIVGIVTLIKCAIKKWLKYD